MNLITDEVLDRKLRNLLEAIKQQSSNLKEDEKQEKFDKEILPLIKKELGESNWRNGKFIGLVNKEEQLALINDRLKKVFGSKNFKEEEYKISKDLILEGIKEIFNPKNFKGDEYVIGG